MTLVEFGPFSVVSTLSIAREDFLIGGYNLYFLTVPSTLPNRKTVFLLIATVGAA